MPRIVFLNRFYHPDLAATAQQLTDLAEDAAAAGWSVSVITGRSSYGGGGEGLPPDEVRNGVTIHRVRTTRFGRRRILGRALGYVSYLLGATWRLLRQPSPDVVVAMTDPPFILAAAVLVGRIRGYRTVYHVQDLYPDVARAMGVLGSGATFHALDAAALWLHARCDAVVVLGERMAARIVTRGAPASRVAVVENWADTTTIVPVPADENHFLEEHGLRDRFVVLYSGNMGRGHVFEEVLEAARRLQDEQDIVFLFIGGGARLPELRRATEEHRLRNVRFLDYLPRDRLRYSLSAANVCLVTEHPNVVGMLVPSKVYGILASGRPLLFVGSPASDVATLLAENDCGVLVERHDAESLVRTILNLRAYPEEAARLGRNGRRAAEHVYDRRILTRMWREEVSRILWPDGATEIGENDGSAPSAERERAPEIAV